MPLAHGARLGPYEISGLIGAGGMGEVYRARDTRLGRDVAVKVIPEDLAANRDRLKRFEQEAQATAALSHPNILALFDVGVEGEVHFIVEELLEGETLRQRLRQGDLSVAKALDLAAQAARGLAAAHAKGIVHRDIKPGNLFVSADGRVKILDFGLAKLLEDTEAGSPSKAGAPPEESTLSRTTRTDRFLGTPAYLAPEQVRGETADHRADIFALGVVLYEALAGRAPFRRESLADTMAAIVHDDPPPLSAHGHAVPFVLDGVVRRCLEKRPEERFQSAHDLALALESLAQASSFGREGEAPLTRPSRRRLVRVAAWGLVALAVGAAFLWGRRSADRPVPRFQRLTFRRGDVQAARFSPDGQTVLYSARWGAQPAALFSVRLDGVESRDIGLDASLAATTRGRMAVVLPNGTLAEAPLEGGVPRELCERVAAADWSPDGTLAIVRRTSTPGTHLGAFLRRSQIESPPGHVLYAAGALAELTGLRASPRGDRIAFVEWPSGKTGDPAGNLVTIDRHGQRTTLSGGWTSIGGVAWSPDGREVWFTAAKSGLSRSLHAVTLTGRERLLAQVGANLVLHDISRDGRALLTQGRVTWEVRGRFGGGTEERDYSWLDGTMAALFSRDGRSFIFNEAADGGGSRLGAYLRRMDGSPPLRLGDGEPLTISSDGKWVVCKTSSFPRQLRLVPTGPGEARALKRGRVSDFQWAHYLPDGRGLVVVGSEKDRPMRLWVQDLPDGEPRPFTPEGTTTYYPAITPDGRFVAGLSTQGDALPSLYPVAGGPPRPIPGITAADTPLRFTPDGRYLFGHEAGGLPARVVRLELATARRVPWFELAPPDRSGVARISVVDVTVDGRSYLYGYGRRLSDLYVVSGLP